jgi:hypothetical protein
MAKSPQNGLTSFGHAVSAPDSLNSNRGSLAKTGTTRLCRHHAYLSAIPS